MCAQLPAMQMKVFVNRQKNHYRRGNATVLKTHRKKQISIQGLQACKKAESYSPLFLQRAMSFSAINRPIFSENGIFLTLPILKNHLF
jgi:hypothetical protein